MPAKIYNEEMNQLALEAAAQEMRDCPQAKLP